MKTRSLFNFSALNGLLLTAYGLLLLLTAAVRTDAATVKSTHTILLGDTDIKINIYENAGARITFFAPHHNEQVGLNAAKEFIEKNGGRLVEIESLDLEGLPTRNMYFRYGTEKYSVDPNRIFTDNGRACAVPNEIGALVKNFSDNLLQIILAPDVKSLREGEIFVVAVHNNTDVSARPSGQRTGDLTAFSFLRSVNPDIIPHGIFAGQADGVYFSNLEPDSDNFIYLTTPKYLGYFAELGFNVIVQKASTRLQEKNCRVDDGSLSVYSGQNSIQYINLEADQNFGAFRQKQMIEAVYKLLPKLPESEPAAGPEVRLER